ncbi:MAG TPA: nitroreductase family protein [Planctomycetota bacterium]|nr:nitroreductase family protein [Planctomycetota bacterium]
MDNVLEFIQKRRSIRQYQKGAEVSDAQVETLLRAAMSAPSAGNQQAWAFIVVRDRARLEAVMTVHPYASMLGTATLAIVVCGDLSSQQYPGYWVQDCAAATQNLLLAAANLGLGACWCGVHPRPEREEGCRKLFSLPEHVVPFAVIAVGVPAEQKAPADYYDAARIHHETW